MKKLLVVMVGLLLTTTMQAQSLELVQGYVIARDASGNLFQVSYNPQVRMFETSKEQWEWTRSHPDETPYLTKTIDGKEYKIVNSSSYCVDRDWYASYMFETHLNAGPAGKVMYIRQEQGKTYRYNESTGGEELVLDMTLDKDDKFVSPNGEVMTVVNVSEEAGVKTLWLKGSESEDVWRSDIGSIYSGMVMPEAFPEFEMKRMAYTVGYQPVFDDDCVKVQYLKYKSNGKKTSTLYENGILGTVEYTFEDDVLHVTGSFCTWTKEGGVCRAQCLVDGNNNIYFSVHGIEGDLMEYQSDIDVKFSGFKAGEYTVYGQAMAPVTLECKAMGNDDEATVIESVEVEKTVDATAIYDLAGRRLDREPEKGMYVKDGRKYLKR